MLSNALEISSEQSTMETAREMQCVELRCSFIPWRPMHQ